MSMNTDNSRFEPKEPHRAMPKGEQSSRGSETQSRRPTDAPSLGPTDAPGLRVSEPRSGRVTDATQDSDDSALAACVRTLQEAADLSLRDGVDEDCLFRFARALKAFEVTTGHKVDVKDLRIALDDWWHKAKGRLPEDADREEFLLLLEDAFARARTPLGSNVLAEAIKRAEQEPLPKSASAFTALKLRRLIAVCYHLQRLSQNAPFFLGVRDAAKIVGSRSSEHASALLKGLVRRGILKVVESGQPGGRRATRFRFVAPD